MMQILHPIKLLKVLRIINKNTLNYSIYKHCRKLNINTVPNLSSLQRYLTSKILDTNSGNLHDETSTIEYDAIEDIDSIQISYDCDISNTINVRNLLYPPNDSAIIEINKCERVDDVCRIVKEIENYELHIRALVQSILVVYDIEKTQMATKLNREFMAKQNLPSDFDYIVQKLDQMKEHMTPDELTCCFLYLNKLGFNISEDNMQNILNECLRRLNDDELFPLTSLSRFVVSMSSVQGNLYIYLICIDIFPRLMTMLEETRSCEDLRLISICLNHLPKLITENVLQIYKNKVSEFLKDGIINKDTVKCILKIVNFLTYPQWSQQNMMIIRQLSLILRDNIPIFQTRELVSLFKIVQNHLEPASLIPGITKQAKNLLKDQPSAELLACAVLYSVPQKRLELTEIAQSIMFSSDNLPSSSLPPLFKVLRLLKISNLKLIDAYWDRVLNEIETNPEEKEIYRIARTSHRYMHFNNNLGGTYRHKQFEKIVSKLILNELENGISNVMPMRFSKLSSFILAYGRHGDDKERMHLLFPEFIVEKFESIAGQLSIFDCLQISRGLQIALEMR